MNRRVDIWSALATQLRKAPSVASLGLLGIALGAACILAGLVRGFAVPPEGNLFETATFDGSVGVFMLTQALLVPESGFSRMGQRLWSGALVVATLYAYGIETVQAIRGLDPRFSTVAGPTDQLLGGVFFLDAVFIMAMFLVLTGRFFRAPANPLRLAVRYAAVACLVSFGVGIWMSFSNGRLVGTEGNLLPIHAAGFHGLQAIPLVALLFAWAGVHEDVAKRWVHRAGMAWVGFCAAVLWQAAAGRGALEVSVAMVLALVLFAAWALVAFTAVRRLSTAAA